MVPSVDWFDLGATSILFSILSHEIEPLTTGMADKHASDYSTAASIGYMMPAPHFYRLDST